MSSIAFRSRAVIAGFMLMLMLALGVPAATAHADDLGLTAGSLADGRSAAAEAPDGESSGGASADSEPLYRLYNLVTGEHLYTLAKDERNALVPIGWVYEGVGWFVPAEGDPVYRLYNPYGSVHFYTTDSEERDSLVDVGWQYEGVAWNTAAKDDEGSIPVYRQYNPNSGLHNYTPSADENRALVKEGWKAEGTAWYASPENAAFVDDMETETGIYDAAGAGEKATYSTVYRLYFPRSGDHLFTVNKGERNSVASRFWHYEGASWMAASAGNPVYRLGNPYTGGHMFTMSAGESSALLAAGWSYEGVCWYSTTEGDGDRIPVYRLYNPNTSGHFFTPSESERDGLVSAGWKSEGIAWYGHALPEGFQDDMAPWTPSISGDAVLDSELEIILFYHKTLRSAFDYVVSFGYRGGERFWSDPHYLSDATTISFAKEMLANNGGNCYRFASLFCWLARGLGYDAYVVSGWVPSASGGSAPHGWTEIWENGTAYVCDPDLAHEIGGGYNWYWFTYNNAPTTYGSW